MRSSRSGMDLLTSAGKTLQDYMQGNLWFSEERAGEKIQYNGREFTVFRETHRDKPGSPSAVLKFKFQPTAAMSPGKKTRTRLIEKLSVATTPMFSGQPGFHSKLWAVNEDTGEFLDIYKWDSVREAEEFARGMRRMMESMTVPGSVSYQIEETDRRL